MSQLEWILYLSASSLYAISTVFYILSVVFKKEAWLRYGAFAAFIGLLPHTGSLYIRWMESGHGPYMTMHEIFSSYAWISVALFLFMVLRVERIRLAGVVVVPVSFIIMGIGATVSRDTYSIPASLNSYWLISHVGFAKLAFGGILIGTALAVLYLLNERQEGGKGSEGMKKFLERFPDKDMMDDLSYQFVSAGFLFLSVMIGAGAIWAYQSWGRYWAWDPIETWSLIVWFIYGIFLHLRMNAGWRGKKSAWLLVLAIFILAFSLFGTGIVYSGLHSSYMI